MTGRVRSLINRRTPLETTSSTRENASNAKIVMRSRFITHLRVSELGHGRIDCAAGQNGGWVIVQQQLSRFQ